MTHSPSPPSIAQHPFLGIPTEKPLVALPGLRNGYLMIAPSQQEIREYRHFPPACLHAAHAWAAQLEQLGSPRAYWLMLSEVTPHLHIHIFPRWPEDPWQGLPLFEQRDQAPQPVWSNSVQQALQRWATQFEVEVLAIPRI